MMQQHLRAPTTKKRAKTVYAQKNLGTIRDKKRQRRQEKEKQETNGSEVIMRILRIRFVLFPLQPKHITLLKCGQTGYLRLLRSANANHDITNAKRAGETDATHPTSTKPTPAGPAIFRCRSSTNAFGTSCLIVTFDIDTIFHCCLLYERSTQHVFSLHKDNWRFHE